MSRRKAWNADPEPLLRVDQGFRLDQVDPDATPGFPGRKIDGLEALAAGASRLAALQERLYAASTAGDQRRVLLVLQAMDTAGKGGIVSHVVGAVDPNGVRYAGFKAPTAEEREHDFLWRIERQLPSAGQLGVFDRSHYEDVLIQRIRAFAAPDEIERRYGAITEFEDRLTAEGTTIVKVMLHISKDEQRERLGERLDRPDKHWKFNPADIDERLLWDRYQDAYQIVFDQTSTPQAPWYVVPANRKWYARLAVQQLLLRALEDMQLSWPKADFDVAEQRQRLAES
ncbi:PPK2 family polyphosphate:nucleotide phosphotransferase [Curtobacterium sp. PhB137]|uniref:PPK2 family polyphosphate kinase n=1 Tax=unclassified Curtobacterium TaxID=257496 RepID=UPI000FB546CC|nr:PPK2 family polyphosphate kinase [Curtobacterium sp. PhB137]RPE85313.1 PPK2 family polyphosphate:nucleotide phosphotransferase [Curtobacterium sp. PhB137]